MASEKVVDFGLALQEALVAVEEVRGRLLPDP